MFKSAWTALLPAGAITILSSHMQRVTYAHTSERIVPEGFATYIKKTHIALVKPLCYGIPTQMAGIFLFCNSTHNKLLLKYVLFYLYSNNERNAH